MGFGMNEIDLRVRFAFFWVYILLGCRATPSKTHRERRNGERGEEMDH